MSLTTMPSSIIDKDPSHKYLTHETSVYIRDSRHLMGWIDKAKIIKLEDYYENKTTKSD